MKAANASDVSHLIVNALNAADVDSIVSLYEPDGVITPVPDRIVRGHAAIRLLAEEFVSQHPRLVLKDVDVVEKGDVALIRSRVGMTIVGPDGNKTDVRLEPLHVVHRQHDGRWLIAIEVVASYVAQEAE